MNTHPNPVAACQYLSYEEAMALFTDPKLKLTRRQRKDIQAQRDCPSKYCGLEAKDAFDKMKIKVTALPMKQLIRALQKAARRAATALYILKGIEPNSRFRPAVEQEQLWHLNVYRTARDEYQRRATAPAVRNVLERSHVEQPHSLNEVTGPTC